MSSCSCIDATVGPTDQDGAIAGAAKEAGKGIIVAANKWDLMKRSEGEDAAKVFDENLRYQLKFLDYAPILHISAVTGERTPKLLEVVDKVAAAARTRVPTGELNRFIEKITTASPPVTSGKRNVRVMYASQTSVAPPTFVLFTNSEAKLHFSYERFLENRLRESYGFFGNPIRIQVRGRKDSRKGEERKTAAERAPERRKPVKKGPGSKPTQCRSRASSSAPRRETDRRRQDAAVDARAVGCPRRYTPNVAAPKRELFKAAEVCEVVQVQPYVLRSWEAEFPQIGQAPAGGGPRLYRRSDVELVLRIKQLVFEEGLTLSGARRRLEEDGGESNGAAGARRGSARRSRARAAAAGEDRAAVDSRDAVEDDEPAVENCAWSLRTRRRRSQSPNRRRRSKLLTVDCRLLTALTGCSAAWLARLLGVQEVPGSNPGIPTNLLNLRAPTNGRPRCDTLDRSFDDNRLATCRDAAALLFIAAVVALLPPGELNGRALLLALALSDPPGQPHVALQSLADRALRCRDRRLHPDRDRHLDLVDPAWRARSRRFDRCGAGSSRR